MLISAVISEYNPFHNGHKYQIDEIKKECDAVIAIMSGSFVQRGDIAIADKWTRAGMALANGVDLVLELPVISVLNSAEFFARGGVFIAQSTGVVERLYFGSECGNTELLIDTAKKILNEPKEVKLKLKEYLKDGMNYPSALERAWSGGIDGEVIKNPNNILGIEYIKALMKYNSEIQPYTIKRIGAGYNEREYCGAFQSATKIRECIKCGEEIFDYLPENVYNILRKSVTYSNNELTEMLKYRVLTEPQKITDINDVSEGLENRIYEGVKRCESFDEIAEFVKSKRYTLARIKRILISIILGLDKEFMRKEPDFIRVLGMNKRGMEILKKMRKSAALPIVVKTADYSSEVLKKDILATDIANLAKNPFTVSGEDFRKSPVIYSE